ncbi:MAG: hypothetical protein KDA84_19735, partial [Planctomycetaceae bacterium]|nr:hypothetical protein [Planctomycetaceae bacterium]
MRTDAATGQLVAFMQGGMEAVDLTSDNELLVTSGRNNEAHVYRISLSSPTEERAQNIRTLVARFQEEDYQTRETAQRQIAKLGMMAVPVLREFAESSDTEVRIRTRELRRRLMSPEPIARLGDHAGDVEVVCFSPDAKWIATGSRGG